MISVLPAVVSLSEPAFMASWLLHIRVNSIEVGLSFGGKHQGVIAFTVSVPPLVIMP